VAKILTQLTESVVQCETVVVQEGCFMQRAQSPSECCINDLKMHANLLQ
jgi:hypothetical protein